MDLTAARKARLAAHPSAPLLTDYTQGRVELSHLTFDNWVTKTVNLLRMEAEIGEGNVVGVELPLHWMTAVWCMAVMEAGADLSFGGPADLRVGTGDADVVVSADPLGMAGPPADAQGEWFFPSDVRGMPDALILGPATPGSLIEYTRDGLFSAAEGFAAEVGLAPGGVLEVSQAPTDLHGLLALIGGALAVDARVVYGSSQEAVTARA